MGSRHCTPGDVIAGKYRIVRELGHGGFGVVYLVEHMFIGRKFALKALHAELCDRDDLQHRLHNEALTLGQMRHPNIVQVTDGGLTDEQPSRPFFVMELLQGMSLGDVLRRLDAKSIGLGSALTILGHVLDALEYAHRRGVIHRDIKPDNIFLHREHEDASTIPKLVDFGVVHVIRGGRSTATFLGTPKYAAPEQIRMTSAPSPKTDLYAIGLVGYEMLTGRHPFAYAKSAEDCMRAQVHDAPAPTGMADDIGKPLLACLAKDPAARPPSAAWLASRLREALHHAAEQAGDLERMETTEETPVENLLRLIDGQGDWHPTPTRPSGRTTKHAGDGSSKDPKWHRGTTEKDWAPQVMSPRPLTDPTKVPQANESVDRVCATRSAVPFTAPGRRSDTIELLPAEARGTAPPRAHAVPDPPESDRNLRYVDPDSLGTRLQDERGAPSVAARSINIEDGTARPAVRDASIAAKSHHEWARGWRVVILAGAAAMVIAFFTLGRRHPAAALPLAARATDAPPATPSALGTLRAQTPNPSAVASASSSAPLAPVTLTGVASSVNAAPKPAPPPARSAPSRPAPSANLGEFRTTF